MICDGSIPDEVFAVIGNGFDIECGLPTDYKSFLAFLAAVHKIMGLITINSKSKALENSSLNPVIKQKLIIDPLEEGYWKKALDTFWYKYFQNTQAKNGWVDFENEISKIIQRIEETMVKNGDNRLLSGDDLLQLPRNSDLFDVIRDVIPDPSKHKTNILPDYIQYSITYRDLAKQLWNDLEVFICSFETYLKEYVSMIEPKKKKSIDELITKIKCKDIHVLTFNYTDTFEKMLNSKNICADFCYIHGKVGNSRNNMVLGIDEHRKMEEVANYLPFAPFRKYNQRIYKETDSRYVDWITAMAQQTTLRRHLYIFGHSLGISDKNVLKSFVMSPNMDTTVFYHSFDCFSKLVGNMTAIIEMDNMIKMNGGTYRTMEFVLQQR